jgi:hypothetical protein
MSFTSPRIRFCIGSIDRPNLPDVSATYNPKEIQYDRGVPWTSHKDRELEYGGTQGRSVTVELFFNGFETNESVAPQVDMLETFALPVKADSTHRAELRPHYCIALWGSAGLPRLLCVIESVSTKYTVLAADGTPLRAVCTVKLKEATVIVRATATRYTEKSRTDRGEAETRWYNVPKG